jgi:6-pyruvoyltetrahydropterin/6-carboxytetrahydropterin synthase
MMKLYLKRKFAAAHYLPGHPKCGGMHGHTWLVEVWLEGEVDPKTGMVVDFGKVKHKIDLLDHPGVALNGVLPLKFQPPTAENLVRYFLSKLPDAYRVRVWESDNSYAEMWAEENESAGF